MPSKPIALDFRAAIITSNNAPPEIIAANCTKKFFCGSVSLFKFMSMTTNKNKTMMAP
jgi:hypothetical protein